MLPDREQSLPPISVIVPCRNEEDFIGSCLESILANDYPHDKLEILIVDGDSTDRTKAVVASYAERYPFIHLLRNERQVTPYALNIGIESSTGQLIARLDAHSTCAPDYLAKCVDASRRTGADNVGGIWRIKPRLNTAVGCGIVAALGHRFGSGNAHYKTGANKVMSVDTVPFGFYRRDVFDRIGLFNEHLARGQDMEFNLRLRRSGGSIVLDPSIVSEYFARSSLRQFWQHNFWDGFWVTYAFRFARIPVAWRHLVPTAFVLGILGLAALSFLHPLFLWMLVAAVGLYAAAALGFATLTAFRARRADLIVTMPLAFAARHLGWGLGSLWGLARLIPTGFVRSPA